MAKLFLFLVGWLYFLQWRWNETVVVVVIFIIFEKIVFPGRFRSSSLTADSTPNSKMCLSPGAAELIPQHTRAARSSTDKITDACPHVLPPACAVWNKHHRAQSPQTDRQTLEPSLSHTFSWEQRGSILNHTSQAFYTVKYLQPSAAHLKAGLLWAFVSKGNADGWEAEKCSREVNKGKSLKRFTAALI